MSTIKFILKDLGVMKLWSVWTRRYIVSTVVRRCIRDRSIREAILRFKHSILRQRRTLLLAATAVYSNHSESNNAKCDRGISDDEMKALLLELENVEDLAKTTLYCTNCGKRLVIDRKQAGVRYCGCKDPKSEGNSSEGWVPYMEADNVIIWRKEYKPGKGLYAYKVYGRYPEVQARDFAAVQIDGAYRRVWDSAVAALSVVQTDVSGVPGQAVLHWEVLWPRLFANRDYVYIRRHKEYDINTNSPTTPHEEAPVTSVHAKARRKSADIERAKEKETEKEIEKEKKNKVYIILNKSCEHPEVPETKNAIRVSEYWSHMVVKTVDGTEKPGMEFVLTYYDEPAVGGMPGGVAAWASSRAAPVYLERMRRAALDYRAWASERNTQELPDFIPFGPDQVHDVQARHIQEQDMESSKQGPELENGSGTRDQSCQTDLYLIQNYKIPYKKDVKEGNGDSKERKEDDNKEHNTDGDDKVRTENVEVKEVIKSGDVNIGSRKVIKEADDKTLVKGDDKESKRTPDVDSDKAPEEEENNGGWWRYLYPFYYFV